MENKGYLRDPDVWKLDRDKHPDNSFIWMDKDGNVYEIDEKGGFKKLNEELPMM